MYIIKKKIKNDKSLSELNTYDFITIYTIYK